MARKSEHSHHHYHIGLLVLILLVAAVGFFFYHRQNKWQMYVVQSMDKTRELKSTDSAEDGQVIASTIVSIPAGNPMLKEPAALEAYIETLSRKTGRDIVVTDNKKKILADTVSTNVGSTYSGDKNGEVSSTIADGQARDFVENSADYPSGIAETVTSFKDLRGSVVGAIIISNSKIFGE